MFPYLGRLLSCSCEFPLDVVAVVVVMVVVEVVVVDFSVVDRLLKKSPRKGRSCVDPDPVELGTTDEEGDVLV